MSRLPRAASEGGSSALVHADLKMHLRLSPAYLGNIRAGIAEQLNRSLLRYISRLRGVVLCYSNIQILDDLGCIANDDPHIHIPVSLCVLLFAPTVGDRLDGVVTRIGSDHMGLLVYGLFNVSIGNPQTPGRRPYKVGKTVTFKVASLSVVDGFLSIVGDLSDGRSDVQGQPPGRAGEQHQQQRIEKQRC
uniref:RPA43 OB domain-containing protein n=1 Tax=Calcidiscus leptoporus TaxID=127549 RepID=A0A7S0J9G8_9EUKA|mmetsp:Transcript_44971/g.105052  ORF Transcript_44971/g.105052 Transcript_44971/m.105052 type:complete len:190 (+) Transcript_44971:3-572(+)